ncbi:DUF4357 domain-containing protein [Microvirga sp. G4-2]|uniref:DUF4357 domain-containing protein n=1 Tax=Microvirga sp. G4-2 TaxID=3434467 RepID=UPI0040447311
MNKYLRSLEPLAGLIAARDPIIRRPDGFSPSIAVMQLSDLPAFAKLALLQRPGIYMGVRYPTAADVLPDATCGEGAAVGPRALTKLTGTGVSWDAVILFTCESDGWTKLHVNDGERRLTAQLEAAGNVNLLFDQSPKRYPITHEDMRGMDGYVAQARAELVRMGIGILEPPPLDVRPEPSRLRRDLTDSVPHNTAWADTQVVPESGGNIVPLPSSRSRAKGPGFAADDPVGTRYSLNFGGLTAEAVKIGPSEVLVLRDSEARLAEIDTLPAYISRRRVALREDGILVPHPQDPTKFILRDNLVFDSASLAAKILTGSSMGAGSIWVRIVDDVLTAAGA